MPRPEMPAMPERLAAVAGIRQNSMPPIQHEGATRNHRVTVVVRGFDQKQLGDTAGVSMFDSRTSGSFRWFPLESFTPAADGALQLETATIASTATVTLARREDDARHGYLVSTQLAFDSTNPVAVELDATVHRVDLQLPAAVDRAGPLQLRRVGDPRWLPIAAGGAGLTIQRSGVSLQLGTGTYELQLPLDPDTAQRFSVPGPNTVVITPALAPATTDRR